MNQTDESAPASLDTLKTATSRLRAEIARRGDAAPAWMHRQLERLEQTAEDYITGPDGTADNYIGTDADTPWWAWCILAGAVLALLVIGAKWAGIV